MEQLAGPLWWWLGGGGGTSVYVGGGGGGGKGGGGGGGGARALSPDGATEDDHPSQVLLSAEDGRAHRQPQSAPLNMATMKHGHSMSWHGCRCFRDHHHRHQHGLAEGSKQSLACSGPKIILLHQQTWVNALPIPLKSGVAKTPVKRKRPIVAYTATLTRKGSAP